MQTIPAAMTWETLARGRWALIAALLGAIGFPALIFSLLQSVSALNPEDASMRAIHIVVMQFNVLMLVSAICIGQGSVSHLYAYPLRNTAIVVWRMLPAMAIAFVETAASIAVLNAWFELGWPLWGPACFVAISVVAVQAGLWLTHKSLLWSIGVLALVAAVLSWWFKSRYGPAFGEPTHLWHRLTPAEFATMFIMASVAYGVALLAVGRNRRGEKTLSLGVVDWLYGHAHPGAAISLRPATAASAQRWFEWRRKGWVMPFSTLVLLVVGVAIWLFASRDGNELFLGLVSGGVSLWFVAFIGGLISGNSGSNDRDFAIGQFLASRPMTDTQLAAITLRTIAASVFLCWLIWVAAVVLAAGVLGALGADDAIQLPPDYSWWFFPGLLLGAWTIAATLASLTLTGSERLFRIVTGLLFGFIALTLFPRFVLSAEAHAWFARSLTAGVAAAIVVGTAWLLAAAYRRAHLAAPTLVAAAGLSIGATAFVCLQWPLGGEPNWFAYLLAAATFALAVAPLAAAPLAIAANRHR